MINFKNQYGIQTLVLLLYFAVIPLLFSYNPQIFHNIKLIAIYLSISMLFFVSCFFYNKDRKEHSLSISTFKIERRLLFLALFIMLVSFFINMNTMQSFLHSEIIGSNIFKGAGPNYLSFFFYLFALIFIATAIVSIKHTDNKLIARAIVVSLIIVGCIILYQIFIYDFLGYGRNYLFGWGNSNYISDPFSIVGLLLLIPVLINKKVNYLYLGIGIFFFEIVLLSESRASFVALFFSVAIVSGILLRMKKIEIKRLLKFYGFAFIILASSYILFSKLGIEKGIYDFGDLNSLIVDNSIDPNSMQSRSNLWTVSLVFFSENILSVLFGIGQSAYFWDTETTQYVVTNAHNQYLDILLSSGIIVFFIFILLLFYQFKYAVRLVKYDITNLALLSSLIFISIKWLFNSINAIQSPFILMVFVLISYRYMEMKNPNNI